MKTTSFLAVCLIASAFVPSAGAFTYRSRNEVLLTADVDGDGRDDALIIDRETGAYRVGYQLAPGNYTWAEARPSGIQGVTSATRGRILSINREAIIVTGDSDNVVNVIDAADPSVEGQLVSVYPGGIGSRVVASLDFSMAPLTPQEDLLITTDESLAGPAGQSYLASQGAGSFATIVATSFGRWTAADRVQLGNGLPEVIGALADTGNTNVFQVVQTGPGTATQLVADLQPVPLQFTFGHFGAGILNQFLFNTPGGSDLVVRTVQQPSPGVFKFGSPAVFPLGFAFDLLEVIPGTPARFLAIATTGSEARVYEFDGVNPPVLKQTLNPSGTDSLTGALPTGGGNFQLLSANANSRRSTSVQPFKFNGTKFIGGPVSALPNVNPLSLGANVFLFQSEPFVNATPGLLRRLNAADWSSKPNLNGGNLSVIGERDRGTSLGLGNPGVRNLGPIPATAHFGLVNQYYPSISLVSFDPVSPSPTSPVTISPVGGPQTQAILVSLSVGDPAYKPLYSLDGGPWTTYSAPFWLFKTTKVRYLASKIGTTTKSPTETVTYTFSTSPGLADSDGDGVPDYVELANHLNPTKGPDTDGDGYSDINEILAGTDPNATNSIPAANKIIDSFQAFDFWAAPRPLDPVLVAETNANFGVRVGVHDLNGALLRSGFTTNVPGSLINPVAPITNILGERQPAIVALSTDPNFSILTSLPDPKVGREMVALARTPVLARPVVNYNFAGGNLAAEAANWAAAAKLAYKNAPHPTVQTQLNVAESVAALLTERKINQVLADRAVPGFNATNLTFFPFRVNDVGRQPATLDQLNALSLELDPAHPGFDLGDLHATIRGSVTNPASALHPLVLLANDIYRISGLSNNASPGNYPLPVDVIRAFLITGQLSSNYAAVTTVTPATRSAATTAVAAFLNSLTGRPIGEFDLTVQLGSFQQGVTRLLDAASGHTKNLFIKVGVPYLFPQSFQLVQGSIVHVVAYTDFTDPNVPGESLQVIDATLISAPPAPVASGGNGLTSDAWGLLFFGGPFDPLGDADNDGFSNLQEFLDGSDPIDSHSHGKKSVQLKVPNLALGSADLNGGNLALSFTFPSGYASAFNFFVQKSTTLGGSYDTLPLVPSQSGPDQLTVQLPAVQDTVGFFRLVMLLK